jgi:DNA-binding response OmpR family regulator
MQDVNELAASRRIWQATYPSSDDLGDKPACERTSACRGRVLIVEDEAPYGRCLLRMIARCGGAATLVGTAHDAYEQLASDASWTGLIVDVRLPDGSGLDLLRDVRGRGVHIPTLIITGLRDNQVAYAAFELSAMYLVKPVEDLYVESLLRRASQVDPGVLREPNMGNIRYSFRELEIDEHTYSVRRNRRPIHVQPLIFDLIVYLIRHRQGVVSKSELLKNVWRGCAVEDSAIGRCVCLARGLVRDRTAIRTIRGRGYQWVAPLRVSSGGDVLKEEALAESPSNDERPPPSSKH